MDTIAFLILLKLLIFVFDATLQDLGIYSVPKFSLITAKEIFANVISTDVADTFTTSNVANNLAY